MESALGGVRVLFSFIHPLGLGSVGMVAHCSWCFQGDKLLFSTVRSQWNWDPGDLDS